MHKLRQLLKEDGPPSTGSSDAPAAPRPQVRINVAGAISAGANMELALNVSMHGRAFPGLVLCECEKNLEVPFRETVFWVTAAKIPFPHRKPQYSEKKGFRYDIKITK